MEFTSRTVAAESAFVSALRRMVVPLSILCLGFGAAGCTVPGGEATGCDDPSVAFCQAGGSVNGQDCSVDPTCGSPGRTGSWLEGDSWWARVQCENGQFLECSAPVGGSNYAQSQQPFEYFGGGVICEIGNITISYNC